MTLSVEQTLAERGARYGDFTDHARIAQGLQYVMRDAEGWAKLSPVQAQALTVIADKIARILSGDPNYDDNWHDIQGYARLAEERLPSRQPANDNQVQQWPALPLCKCGMMLAAECNHGAGCNDG
jgi:hypothetical protein